jgi:hypothetical protein
MPWKASDAQKHTKKASTAGKQKQWADVADSALRRGSSEGSAVRQANSVVGGSTARKTVAKKPVAKKK